MINVILKHRQRKPPREMFGAIRSASLLACVASVSVRFRRRERAPLPLPPLSLFGSRSISRAVKTESLRPRYFFAPKPNGNACYAGYKFIKIINFRIVTE